MQSGILGLLIAAQSSVSAGVSSGQSSGSDKGLQDDTFSQFLSDASAQQQGQSLAGTAAASEWIGQSSISTLVAQEVSSQPQAEAAAISQLLNQPITPQNADSWLSRLQQLSSEGSVQTQANAQMQANAHAQADAQTNANQQSQTDMLLSQMADAVGQVKETGQPTKLGDIVSQLPAVQQAQGEAAQGAQMQSVLQLVKQMFSGLKCQAAATAASNNDASTEMELGQKATTSADDTASNPIAQSLQASLFPADNDTTTPPAKDKDKDSKRDTVQIVPLSADAVVPTWVNQAAPVQASSDGTQTAAADIDQAVPSLTDAAGASKPALPSVNLPSMGHTDDDKDADGDSDGSSGGAPASSSQGAHSFSQTLSSQSGTQATNQAQASGDASAAVNAAAASAGNGQHAAPAASAGAPAAAAAGQMVNHAPVSGQVQVAVTRGLHDGIQQMTIQLDPADLGRVEVHMHTQSDGQTHLSFIVDKPQTLDSLSRDARSLERSLQDAGVKTDAGNMQFNLRQQPQSNLQNGGQFSQNGSGRPQWDKDDDGKDSSSATPAAAAISATQNYTLSLRDGVDIRA